VGARMRVDSPRAMAGHPSCWGRVGAGKTASNQARTAGWKRVSGDLVGMVHHMVNAGLMRRHRGDRRGDGRRLGTGGGENADPDRGMTERRQSMALFLVGFLGFVGIGEESNFVANEGLLGFEGEFCGNSVDTEMRRPVDTVSRKMDVIRRSGTPTSTLAQRRLGTGPDQRASIS
jgi:hypothetical protein